MRARAHTPGPSTSCPCSEETPHRFAGKDALQELPEEVLACPQHRKQGTPGELSPELLSAEGHWSHTRTIAAPVSTRLA